MSRNARKGHARAPWNGEMIRRRDVDTEMEARASTRYGRERERRRRLQEMIADANDYKMHERILRLYEPPARKPG